MTELSPRIFDIISMPEVKTVIHLRDLEVPTIRKTLAKHFVFTEEVSFIFKTIFTGLKSREGKGFFLLGNYGSGKSHLLFTLSALLGHSDLRGHFRLDRQHHREILDTLEEREYLVVTVPLQEHRNIESLEQTVMYHLARTISAATGEKFPTGVSAEALKLLKTTYTQEFERFLAKHSVDVSTFHEERDIYLAELFIAEANLPIKSEYQRNHFLPKVQEILKKHNKDGLVLIIDELSEFVRSKLQARHFQEDIRYLQFLGESSQQVPIWIIASLQERIEETGDIPHQTFHKIKDRYPVRLILSGQHIKELVSSFLIRKKSDGLHYIHSLYESLLDVFGKLPFSREDLLHLYPIHPSTINFLEELRPLFSQHRGIVDFIHYTIVGDAGRKIISRGEEPYTWLLTPDYIFDHFRLRIKETFEWNRYHDIVFHYYEQNIPLIFTTEQERILALRLIKVLVLAKLFSTAKELSVEELTLFLLHRVTDLDPSVNFHYTEAVLDRLVQQGAYLIRRENTGRCTTYFIDVSYDINVIIDKKINEVKQQLFPGDNRYFSVLVEDMEDSFLPLSTFPLDEIQTHDVMWLNSKRQGMVVVTGSNVEVEGWKNNARRSLQDSQYHFLMCILHPLNTDEGIDRLQEVLLNPLAPYSSRILLWIPQPLEETDQLQSILARRLLLRQLEREKDTQQGKIVEQMRLLVSQDRPVVREILRTCYTRGEIVDGNGNVLFLIQDLGLLPFPELLSRMLSDFFQQLYPKHYRIAALIELYHRNRLDELIEHFLNPGVISIQSPKMAVLRNMIDGYMKPMRLTKQIKGEIFLDCDPNRSEIARQGLQLLHDQQLTIAEWSNELRDGDYGLSGPQLELLLLGLIFSGNITAYSGKKPIDPHKMSVAAINTISSVGPGEIISAAQQELLRRTQLIPEELLSRGYFSIIKQQEVWQWLCLFKATVQLKIEAMREKRFDSSYSFIKDLLLSDKISQLLDHLYSMTQAICISYDSRRGLLHFLDFIQEHPFMSEELLRFEALSQFFGPESSQWRKTSETFAALSQNRFLTLDEPRYHDLQLSYNKFREILLSESFLFQLEKRAEAQQLWDQFFNEYKSLYSYEHKQYHSPESLKQLEIVTVSTPSRVLRLLSGIKFLPDDADSKEWSEKLNAQKRELCAENIDDLSHEELWCNCGFQLADTRESYQLNHILNRLDGNVRAMFLLLKESQFRETIIEQLKSLDSIGKSEHALHIKKIFGLSPESSGLTGKLAKFLSPGVVNTINDLFDGSFRQIPKDFSEFFEPLKGKTISAKKLIELLTEWLDVEGDDFHIQVDFSAAQSEKNLSLQTFLKENAPEFRSLMITLGIVFFERFLLCLFWLDERNVALKSVFTLFPSLQERDNIPLNRLLKLAKRYTEQFPHAFEEVDRQLQFQEDSRLWFHRFLDISATTSLADFIVNEKRFPFLVKNGCNEMIILLIQQNEGVTADDITLIGNAQTVRKMEPREHNIEHIQQIYDYIEARQKLTVMGTTIPEKYTEWERFFVSVIGPLHLLKERAADILRQRGLNDYLPLLQLPEVERQGAVYNDHFRKFYTKDSECGQKINTFIQNLVPRISKKYGQARTHYLLIDGMRWDLWEIVKSEIVSLSFKIIREETLWAYLPTNTERQLNALTQKQTMKLFMMSDRSDRTVPVVEEIHIDEILINKINLVDTRIHTSRDSLPLLYREIIFHLKETINPLIERIPSGDILVIFADHGFTENELFNEHDKYKNSRYQHGGESLHEVLVPGVILYKL